MCGGERGSYLACCGWQNLSAACVFCALFPSLLYRSPGPGTTQSRKGSCKLFPPCRWNNPELLDFTTVSMSLSSKEEWVFLYPCRGPKAWLGTRSAATRAGIDALPLGAGLLLSLGQQSSACSSGWSDTAGLHSSPGRDMLSFIPERVDSSFLSNAGLLE